MEQGTRGDLEARVEQLTAEVERLKTFSMAVDLVLADSTKELAVTFFSLLWVLLERGVVTGPQLDAAEDLVTAGLSVEEALSGAPDESIVTTLEHLATRLERALGPAYEQIVRDLRAREDNRQGTDQE